MAFLGVEVHEESPNTELAGADLMIVMPDVTRENASDPRSPIPDE